MIAIKPREVVTQKPDSAVDTAGAPDWKRQWRTSFTDLAKLLAYLELDVADFACKFAPDAGSNFALRVPLSFAARMRKGDAKDPLLLQVLPSMAERIERADYVGDPVADLQHSPSPGLIHKYGSRVLLVAAGTCAVNCRYCFRREYPYGSASLRSGGQNGQNGQIGHAATLRYIAEHPQINEVILSGGDPLALDNARLHALTDALCTLPQIRRIRLHTRTPVVLPARVDAGFLAWVGSLKVPLIMVLHSNHANEWVEPELRHAMAALRTAQVTLLNQAVLLARINDDATVQAALSEALFDAGVLPYYLNLLDPVTGSAHFAVPDARAAEIYAQMAATLPGFLLPKLVRDVAGSAAKQQAFGA